MRRIRLIVNPRSGNNCGVQIAKRACHELAERGCEVGVVETGGPGDATRLARQIGDACDAVVAVGGDGTLTEVVAGRLDYLETPVGIIPAGCANVVAREFGIPLRRPEAAARTIAAGATACIDLAAAGDRTVLANASVGFDAMVVDDVARRRRAGDPRVGMTRYVPAGLSVMRHYRAPRVKVTVDGIPWEGRFSSAVVCNLANYGGLLRVTPDADPRDGLLDVCARRGGGRFSVLRHLACALARWKDGGDGVRYGRGTTVRLEADGPTSLQVDGDDSGRLPIEIRVTGAKLRLLVPTGGTWS